MARTPPRDRIDFVVDPQGSVTLRRALLDVRDLRGMLRREGEAPVSVEAMNEAIRRGATGHPPAE